MPLETSEAQKREVAPAERSEQVMSGIETQYGLRGKPAEVALDIEKRSPGPAAYESDISERITGLAKATEALKGIIGKDYAQLTPQEKVQYEEARQEALKGTNYPFGSPEEYQRVQQHWENAAEEFKKRGTDQIERRRIVVSGEMSADDIKKLSELKFKEGRPGFQEAYSEISGEQAMDTFVP